MLGITYGRWSVLFTLASMVGTVNAVVLGASCGLLLDAGLGVGRPLAVTLGILIGGGAIAGMLAYQRRRFARSLGIRESGSG